MELTVGAVLEGKVKSITNFGAFIALPENKTGMVHISEVANAYVSDIHQHLTEGQDVKVMVIGLDNGKINLDNMGSTRMMCADMTNERKVLEALGKVKGYEIDAKGNLLLTNAQGKEVMLLVKKK